MDNNENLKFGEEFEQNFGPIDAGDYEVTLVKVEKRVAQTGRKYLNLTLEVRRDIDQPFGGRKLFTKIFANDDDATYNHAKINHIIVTQKFTGEHYKTEFKSFDDILQYLHGLNFIVSVDVVFNEVTEKDENKIIDWSYKPSTKPIKDEEPAIKGNNLDSIEIPDIDIPF